MAANWDEFWNRTTKAAPGLFDLGAGIYGQQAGSREAANRLKAAQGPVYDASMQGAQQALSQAGNMDPNAFAKQRYDAQQGLLAGGDAKSEADIIRSLQARGMLGAANYNPGVEGITPNGTPMNPQLAAYYAAKNARDAKMSADSMDAGQKQIDTYINRGGMLQRTAGGTQATGITAQGTQPSKTAATMQILKGLGGVAKDAGLFGMAGDWLKRQFGGGGYEAPFSSMSSDSIDW